MSQKAWVNAYTKGSKALQDKLAKVHKNNPEFQEFVKKHGFGGNLSVKQSGLQKKTVAPTPKPNAAQGGDQNREQMIKDIATKLRNRRLAASNRASFGGELGGDFSVHSGGFRRYSEETELNELSDKRLSKYIKKAGKSADRLAYYSDSRNDPDWIKSNKREKMIAVAKRKLGEDIAYKDGAISMRRGGWIAKRNGKQVGIIHPTEELAKALLDNTRMTLGRKVGDALRKKAKELARSLDKRRMATEAVSGLSYKGLKSLSKQLPKSELKQMSPEDQASFQRIRKHFAKRANVAYLGGKKVRTESAANRNRIRSWDSAVLPVEHDHPLHTPHPKAKLDALRAAGKHEEARELERSWLRKAMSKAKKTENSK